MHKLLIEFSEIVARALSKRWLDQHNFNDRHSRTTDTAKSRIKSRKRADSNPPNDLHSSRGDLSAVGRSGSVPSDNGPGA